VATGGKQAWVRVVGYFEFLLLKSLQIKKAIMQPKPPPITINGIEINIFNHTLGIVEITENPVHKTKIGTANPKTPSNI
jgi:hypothetical protein